MKLCVTLMSLELLHQLDYTLVELSIWLFKVAGYDIQAKKMAFFDPSRAKDFLFISGTKMRTFAKSGENLPGCFMCPGGCIVFVNYYASLRSKESHQPAALSS
ncbi:hypothetical protein MKX01_002366 [Papaver californicum]|nr:hypothetical protein MKX01_002366 [Papaver californicum]